jgi:hypothetical protein
MTVMGQDVKQPEIFVIDEVLANAVLRLLGSASHANISFTEVSAVVNALQSVMPLEKFLEEREKEAKKAAESGVVLED